jgi:hypothetical protein
MRTQICAQGEHRLYRQRAHPRDTLGAVFGPWLRVLQGFISNPPRDQTAVGTIGQSEPMGLANMCENTLETKNSHQIALMGIQ